MSTDYACQAAVAQAARGIAPVRALLMPATPPAPPGQDEDLPPALRAYLGTDGSGGPSPDGGKRGAAPVSQAHAAAILLLVLEGLEADLSGVLAHWFAGLGVRLPQSLGVPAAAAPGAAPARTAGGWEALADVQNKAQEVLTVLVDRRNEPVRPGELSWRLALVEDALSGALRRLNIPVEESLRCARDLGEATGSLFGLRPMAQRQGAAGGQGQQQGRQYQGQGPSAVPGQAAAPKAERAREGRRRRRPFSLGSPSDRADDLP